MVVMISLGALCGCGNRTPSQSGDETTTADSVTTRRPLSATIDSTIVALGNEPFWNVRVTAREILYTDPERLDGYRFPPVDAVEDGDARVYRTRRNVLTGEPGPRTLELRIQVGTCSDGMSDRVYPMTAALKIGDETRTGCAWCQNDTLSTEP